MRFPKLDNAIWFTSFLAQAGLLLILLFRKRLQGLPGFKVYIGYEVAQTAGLFLTSRFGSKGAYFWAYWISAFAADPIQCWLIIEIARDVLKPLSIWGRNIQRSVLAWGVIILIAAMVLAAGIGPPGAKGFDLWENRAGVFVSVMMSGMLAVLSMTVLSHGSLGRPHVVAVGYGLFVWTYSTLIQDFVQSIVGWNHSLALLNYVREFLYLAVLVYWMIVFWNSEKPRPPLTPEVIAYMNALHHQITSDLTRIGEPVE